MSGIFPAMHSETEFSSLRLAVIVDRIIGRRNPQARRRWSAAVPHGGRLFRIESGLSPQLPIVARRFKSMKLVRPLILALAIAGGFFYFTTWRSNSHSAGLHPSNWLRHPARVEITEASGGGDSLDGEEQNNISVYHKNIPSVVNITSRAMTFDFFYGLVPQEGQGSGFGIDKEGHILTNYHVVAAPRQVEVTLHNRTNNKPTSVG